MVYVVFVVAVAMLLAAIFWPKKREKKTVGGCVARQKDVVADALKTVLAVEEVSWGVGAIVELPGVLDFDEGMYQRCGSCREAWYGDRIPSGKCSKCGGELFDVIKSKEWPQRAHLVVSKERLERLIQKINQRIRERARWASAKKA